MGGSRKLWYTLAVLLLLLLLGTLGSAINFGRGWHTANEVLLNPATNAGLDETGPGGVPDGLVDLADNALYAQDAQRMPIDCLNHRSPSTLTGVDSVTWCTEQFPKILGCFVNRNGAQALSTTGGACTGDGYCDSATAPFGARTSTAQNPPYAEVIYKTGAAQPGPGGTWVYPSVEGCYVYNSGSFAATSYRVDISCCRAAFTGGSNPASCGDGTINPGEQCDPYGANPDVFVAGDSCAARGYDYGSLTCDSYCTVSTSGCRYSTYVEPSCFGAGTLVLTPDGPRPIELLREGDAVLSYDEASGSNVESTITQYRNWTRDHYYLLNGDVKVTAEHRFAVLRRAGGANDDSAMRWIEAQVLAVGDELRTLDGAPLRVASIERHEVPELLDVYNPAIAAPNTYYILLNGTPVLVHNRKCECCVTPPQQCP